MAIVKIIQYMSCILMFMCTIAFFVTPIYFSIVGVDVEMEWISWIATYATAWILGLLALRIGISAWKETRENRES